MTKLLSPRVPNRHSMDQDLSNLLPKLNCPIQIETNTACDLQHLILPVVNVGPTIQYLSCLFVSELDHQIHKANYREDIKPTA